MKSYWCSKLKRPERIRVRPPDFWYGTSSGLVPQMLRPVGALYALASRVRRTLQTPWHPSVPVICVGNLTAGGTGKTPTAIAIARLLQENDLDVHFLSRGYGSSVRSPLRVDPVNHDAKRVGDEPLLLASVAPTWVSSHRRASAQQAVQAGAEILVMDDGHQNPSIRKDLSLVVVDGEVGFGNGKVLPAGPLRETVPDGLGRADAVLVMGDDRCNISQTLQAYRNKSLTVFRGTLEPDGTAQSLHGIRVLAFAGIGRPEKFYATLRHLGCEIVETQSFPDHHAYSVDEVHALVQKAKSMNAQLITTTKDKARLGPSLARQMRSLPVHVRWADEPALKAWLRPVLKHLS